MLTWQPSTPSGRVFRTSLAVPDTLTRLCELQFWICRANRARFAGPANENWGGEFSFREESRMFNLP